MSNLFDLLVSLIYRSLSHLYDTISTHTHTHICQPLVEYTNTHITKYTGAHHNQFSEHAHAHTHTHGTDTIIRGHKNCWIFFETTQFPDYSPDQIWIRKNPLAKIAFDSIKFRHYSLSLSIIWSFYHWFDFWLFVGEFAWVDSTIFDISASLMYFAWELSKKNLPQHKYNDKTKCRTLWQLTACLS